MPVDERKAAAASLGGRRSDRKGRWEVGRLGNWMEMDKSN